VAVDALTTTFAVVV